MGQPLRATFLFSQFCKVILIYAQKGRWHALGLMVFGLLGCQSAQVATMPHFDNYDDKSQADSAAYAMEHFTWHKLSPSRPKNTYEFYYKHCERLTDVPTDHISKTEWACTPSPF